MSLNSINTNNGAAIALQNLANTQNSLQTVQQRLSTGLKVGSAKDNAAVYAIAQNTRANVAGLDSVKGSLERGQSAVDVAATAGQSISDVLSQMKEKALAAADTSISTASRQALTDEFESLRDQITKITTNASFDGMNLIKSGATDLVSIANSDLSKITVAAQDLSLSTTSGLGQFGVSAAATFSTAGTASAMAAALDNAIADVSTKLGKLGTGSTALERQGAFIGKLQDSLNNAIGNLVDADLAKESAKLQALQTKQQLGVQALSIANQSTSSILSLFR
jgi:flagellin